jgi:hypothetical protein
MIKTYLRRLIAANKEAILTQVLAVRGLMQLLMKTRNTGVKLTTEERKEIRKHLRNMAKMIPALAVFALPGGSFLLPVLADALDRRRVKRHKRKEEIPLELRDRTFL